MSAIYLLIPISFVVAVGFLAGFIWAVRSGQYEDTCTPALRILTDDPSPAQTGARFTETQPTHPDES